MPTPLDGELERLYCQCRRQLFTCALVITRSPACAEDTVHEAFCRLFRQDQQPDDLKAYVFPRCGTRPSTRCAATRSAASR